ncbi:MAG: 6,7-dimethyl-8-ribityllumazine synthase [Steroidobacteraceae bacterium]|nr:6,7-dimethyl-8-ribityllumazine synthase [Steroidobacteraceae bacterium]
MGRIHEGRLDGAGLRVAIVATRWNGDVVARLVAGARDAAMAHGIEEAQIDLAYCPGAFELPYAAQRLALTGRYDAIVALGCVIRGETAHFDYVAGEAAQVGAVARETGVPVGFGVLTTDTVEQALDRAGGKAGNKGAEAMLAAIETARLARAIEENR